VSQLIQKLKIAARLEVPPLGFTGVSKAKPKPAPVLVARVTGEEKQAAELVDGADAVFIDTHQEEVADRFIKQLAKQNSKMPYGCWLGSITNFPNDFYALTLETEMTKIKEIKAGKALVVDPEIEDKYLRQLDSLPIDAVVIENKEGVSCRLTIKNYILCRRMALAVTKPLLIHVDSTMTAGDIEEMWSRGIDGFVVDVDPSFPAEIKELRGTIDGLKLDPRHKQTSFLPVVPSVKVDAEPVEVSSPDEDDDDYGE